MRYIIYLLSLSMVLGVAYWAYTENYTTRASNLRVQNLQTQIVEERSALSELNAEWAYLNRPERLRDLADMNFESLRLVPLSARHFAELSDIPLPRNFEALPSSLDETEPVKVGNPEKSFP